MFHVEQYCYHDCHHIFPDCVDGGRSVPYFVSMKWILFLFVSVSVASGQTSHEKLLIRSLMFPELPPLNNGHADSPAQSAYPKASNQESPVNLRTAILYHRKKPGSHSLILRSDHPMLVKVIDVVTNRLDSLVWLQRNGLMELSSMPASRYIVLFCEDIHWQGDRLVPGRYGKMDGEFPLFRDGERIRVTLDGQSAEHRVVASTIEEWNRHNPPKFAAP